MPAAYSFVSVWAVPASSERVWRELEQTLRCAETPGGQSSDSRPVWWPGVSVVGSPGRFEPGMPLSLVVRSPVGYRLRVRLTLSRIEPGTLITATGRGDLRGNGSVEITERAPDSCEVTVWWNVRTERAWMNATAWLLRPVFVRAHARVMRAGERGLTAAMAGASG